MPKFPIETPLEYLAKKVFPDYRNLTAELSGLSTMNIRSNGETKPTAERRTEFEAWMKNHRALPIGELNALVAAEKEKEIELQSRLIEQEEKKQFFYKQDSFADFEHWSKMAHWTIDEAIALSLGSDPKKVNHKSIEPCLVVRNSLMAGNIFLPLPPSPFAVKYDKRMELARRAVQWKRLYDPILPNLFLAWAERLEISVPDGLTDAIKARGLIIKDWQGLYEKQSEELKNHKAMLDDAKKGLQQLVTQSAKHNADMLDKIKILADKCNEIVIERDQLLATANESKKFDLKLPDSLTLNKLKTIINEYPKKYGTNKPKLDVDVRPWMKDEFSCNEREQKVFGAIISELFMPK
jgi:hypothetical protein